MNFPYDSVPLCKEESEVNFGDSNESPSVYIVNIVNRLLKSLPSGQFSSEDISGIISQIQLCSSYLSNFKNSELYILICRFMSICSLLGYIPAKYESSIFSFISKHSFQNRITYLDLIETGLSLFTFISNNQDDVMKSVFSNNIEKEFIYLVDAMPHVECGRLPEYGISDEQEYEQRLIALSNEFETLIACAKSEYATTLLKNKFHQLHKVISAFRLVRSKGGLREAPYSVLLSGPSGQGKSQLCHLLINYIMKVNGFPFQPTNIVTLNEADKFASEYRTYHSVVILDDIANTTPNYIGDAPCATIIDFINNVRKHALNPQVELKGNISIEPKLVMGTTNVPHLDSVIYSREPTSILRRFKLHVSVKLKEEFLHPSGVADGEKMANVPFGFIDFYDLDLYYYGYDDAGMMARFDVLSNAGVSELFQYVRKDSMEYYSNQKKFVNSVDKLYTQDLCLHHNYVSLCKECDVVPCEAKVCSFKNAFFLIENKAALAITYLISQCMAFWSCPYAYLTYCVTPLVLLFKRFDFRYRKRQEKLVIAGICSVVGLCVFVCYKIFKKQNKKDSPIVTDKTPNMWKTPVVSDLPINYESRTITFEDLSNLVHKNTLVLTIEEKSSLSNVNALAVKSGYLLMNKHIVPLETVKVSARFGPESQIGRRFSFFCSPKDCAQFSNDLALVRVPAMGDVKNLLPYFPNAKIDQRYYCRARAKYPCDLYFDGFFRCYKDVSLEFRDRYVPNEIAVIDSDCPPCDGFCGTAYIAKTRTPFICGVHSGSHHGYKAISFVTGNDLTQQISKLQSNYLDVAETDVIPTEMYSVNYMPLPTIHERSPTRFLDEGSLLHYGSHKLCSGPVRSDVITTKISPYITKYLDQGNIWGPPQFRPRWKPWQNSLVSSSMPLVGFPKECVDYALKDYYRKILKGLQGFELSSISPLKNSEVINGIDGVKFIDALKPKTSVGFPLSKRKSDFLTTIKDERFLDARFWDEADRMCRKYLARKRAYPIFKASLKDEPTKLTKDKVRVFQAAPIALQLILRKYFLPLCRLISTHVQVFECAVGLNSHSREWDRMVNYVNRFGADRIIAGDFKTFDLRMNPEFVLHSFNIFINLARKCNYSDDDLTIMESVATDVAFPLMDFNGELLQLFGSNPSGQNLTVYTNSIVNSLYHRCVFYELYGDMPFDEAVSLITYGDDCKASVNYRFPLYNHTNVSNVFSKYDIVYTMAEKDQESIPYVNHQVAPFLKRYDTWNPYLQLWQARLDEMSIFKSLHCMKRSSLKEGNLTMDEHNAANVDGALREWWFHGKELYETRRSQLYLALSEAGMLSYSLLIGRDYKSLLDEWVKNYM